MSIVNGTSTVQAPTDRLPHETSLSQFIGYGIFLPMVAGLGIMGNLAAAVVLSAKGMRNAATAYLTALMFCDCAFLFSSVFSFTPLAIWEYTGVVAAEREKNWPTKMFTHAFPVVKMGQTIQTFFVLGISIDKYMVQRHPLWPIQYSTYSKAWKISMLIFCGGFLVRFLHIFTFQDREIATGGGVIVYRTCLSDLFLKDAYKVYDVYISVICWSVIPWVAILVLQLLMIPDTFGPKARARSAFLKAERLDDVVTCICYSYLICTALYTAGEIDNMTRPLTKTAQMVCGKWIAFYYLHFAHVSIHLATITQLLLALNSALNVVFFLACSKKFRSQCRKSWPFSLLCKKKPPKMEETEHLFAIFKLREVGENVYRYFQRGQPGKPFNRSVSVTSLSTISGPSLNGKMPLPTGYYSGRVNGGGAKRVKTLDAALIQFRPDPVGRSSSDPDVSCGSAEYHQHYIPHLKNPTGSNSHWQPLPSNHKQHYLKKTPKKRLENNKDGLDRQRKHIPRMTVSPPRNNISEFPIGGTYRAYYQSDLETPTFTYPQNGRSDPKSRRRKDCEVVFVPPELPFYPTRESCRNWFHTTSRSTPNLHTNRSENPAFTRSLGRKPGQGKPLTPNLNERGESISNRPVRSLIVFKHNIAETFV